MNKGAAQHRARVELNAKICAFTIALYESILPELLTGHGITGPHQARCIEVWIAAARTAATALPVNPSDSIRALEMFPQVSKGLEVEVRAQIAAALKANWLPGFGPIKPSEN